MLEIVEETHRRRPDRRRRHRPSPQLAHRPHRRHRWPQHPVPRRAPEAPRTGGSTPGPRRTTPAPRPPTDDAAGPGEQPAAHGEAADGRARHVHRPASGRAPVSRSAARGTLPPPARTRRGCGHRRGIRFHSHHRRPHRGPAGGHRPDAQVRTGPRGSRRLQARRTAAPLGHRVHRRRRSSRCWPWDCGSATPGPRRATTSASTISTWPSSTGSPSGSGPSSFPPSKR